MVRRRVDIESNNRRVRRHCGAVSFVRLQYIAETTRLTHARIFGRCRAIKWGQRAVTDSQQIPSRCLDEPLNTLSSTHKAFVATNPNNERKQYD